METRAPFVIVGAFVLAAIAAVFGFVFWLHSTGNSGPRTAYQIQFDGSVPGLLVGAAVLFNGIRVGEVTRLDLAPDSPSRVNAGVSVVSTTPVRSDTKVGLDFQGLTGVPVIALEGGKLLTNSAPVTMLVAETGAGRSMTQAARDALGRVDGVLADNAAPLKSTIANLQVFSEGLARNTGKLDGIVSGLERMTGGGASPVSKVTYNLQAAADFPAPITTLKGQFTIPEPTAVVQLQTQRFLFSQAKDSAGFPDAQWADSIPKLIQAKLLESFENYDVAHAPTRPMDGVQPDYQILIDIRQFNVGSEDTPAAEIALSTRILDKDGKVVASRIFHQDQKIEKLDAPGTVRAFDAAFSNLAKDLVVWVTQSF
jgi:phospholipid/cholesterol/gamma-HCH transport system substrate-binding protein